MEVQPQVRLVFAGEVLDGFAVEEVKRRFGELFKLEGDRLAKVFSGQRTVLKREMAHDDAERYVDRLRKLGMRVRVEPLDAAPAAKPVAAAAAATVAGLSAPSAGAATAAPALSITPLVPAEEEVECPNCGERQPKRFILCRKCTTDIPRAIASRQEDAERARAERLAARQQQAGGRYAPPNAEVGEYVGSGDLVDPPPMLSLSFEGRMGRVSYFNTWFVAMLGIAGMGVLAAVLVPAIGMLIAIPAFLGLVVFLVWGIRVNVLRLHDVNRSGWWVLLTGIPYLGAVVSLLLMVWPGSAEENDFGPKPRRGNVALAVGVLVLTVVSFIAVFSVSRKYYGEYVERARQAQEQAEQEQEQQAGQLDARAQRTLSGPAAEAFRDQYMGAADNKAFAISGKAAYGFASGKPTRREAVTAALAACEERREPYTSNCRIVNVNGMWPKERDE